MLNAQWAITSCEQFCFLHQSHRPSGLINLWMETYQLVALGGIGLRRETISTVFSLLCQDCQSLKLFLCRKVFAFLGEPLLDSKTQTVRFWCLKIEFCYHTRCMILYVILPKWGSIFLLLLHVSLAALRMAQTLFQKILYRWLVSGTNKYLIKIHWSHTKHHSLATAVLFSLPSTCCLINLYSVRIINMMKITINNSVLALV